MFYLNDDHKRWLKEGWVYWWIQNCRARLEGLKQPLSNIPAESEIIPEEDLKRQFETCVLLDLDLNSQDSRLPCWKAPIRRLLERNVLCYEYLKVASWPKLSQRRQFFLNGPSKSRATIRVSSRGVTDIHTPSVVRMAEPANDVSTRWLRVKLLPTDCSPIEETTFTG